MGAIAKLETVDAAGMRAQNSSLLLNMIWRERRISRADIARLTGLSPSTVSAIVSDLERSGLVRDLGAGVSRGGRKPTLLGFCDDAFSIVGVEVGAHHLRAVLTDLRGEVRLLREGTHPVRDEPEGALAMLRSFIDECLEAGHASRGQVLGIGLAVPSPVRFDAPGRMHPVTVPAWRNYDVKEILANAYHLPVLIDNDANLGALAERWWGAGRDGQDLTYLKIATGIGAGHIIGGDVYRGVAGTAGEIGHLLIDPSGPRCPCGLQGCITSFIGSPAIVRMAKARLPGASDRLSTIEDVIALALEGEPAIRELVAEVGRYLGVAAATLTSLLNPAVLVLGGEIATLGELLLEPVRAVVRQRGLASAVRDVRIVTSDLGSGAIAIGAATLLLRAALADRTVFPQARAAVDNLASSPP